MAEAASSPTRVALMKAVAFDAFGVDPTNREIPVPSPGEGELLVEVSHASVNGMDVGVWIGVFNGRMDYEFPITLGRDFAGTVTQLGPGVDGFHVGDAVFGVHLKQFLHDGTFAEQVAVPAAMTAPRPAGLEPRAAGALGMAGTTALLVIEAIAPGADETVLISGATGGVGALVIQLARRRGARVIATATPDKADFVRNFGADEVVDYTRGLSAELHRLGVERVQCAVHLAGNGVELAELVEEGGRFASTLEVGPEQLQGRPLRATAVHASTQLTTQAFEKVGREVIAGGLQVPITRSYDLEEVPQALKDFRAGALGKLAVVVR